MHELEAQAIRAAAFAVALAVATALQRFVPHAGARGSVRVNGGLWMLDLVVLGATCGACVCTAARWAAAHQVGVLNLAGAPRWLGIAVAVLALDLVSYMWHRANHRLAILWRFHQVHHADESFTVSTAVRFHPGELLLSLPIRLGAAVLLGVPWQGVLVFEALFTMANFVEHGDIALPEGMERAIQGVVVTPALHRRHHSRAGSELDRNFGTIFSMWDRWLGTFLRSGPHDRFAIGLPSAVRAPTLRAALALPFRRDRARMPARYGA